MLPENLWYRRALTFSVVLAAALTAQAQGKSQEKSVPILYSTDLYHPHEDPDDHYDLATLFALPELDIRGIVIDMGEKGAGRPGVVPLRQMMHLTGRDVPVATGLRENLLAPDDKALEQPAEAQAGVELIMKALHEATEPVTVFTTGSLRDVAAAYNREPQLMSEKVRRLYINAGHSSGGEEYNVKLDPHAYVRMLRSGLPVFWVPCFGADGYESFWKFRQADVLETAPQPVQNFFLYALTQTSPQEREPIQALTAPVDAEAAQRIFPKERNMWCTGAFLHATGRTNPTFSFKQVKVQLDDAGVTRIVNEGGDLELQTFHIDDAAGYPDAMREALKALIDGLVNTESKSVVQ